MLSSLGNIALANLDMYEVNTFNNTELKFSPLSPWLKCLCHHLHIYKYISLNRNRPYILVYIFWIFFYPQETMWHILHSTCFFWGDFLLFKKMIFVVSIALPNCLKFPQSLIFGIFIKHCSICVKSIYSAFFYSIW